jgi:hypothetical protein
MGDDRDVSLKRRRVHLVGRVDQTDELQTLFLVQLSNDVLKNILLSLGLPVCLATVYGTNRMFHDLVPKVAWTAMEHSLARKNGGLAGFVRRFYSHSSRSLVDLSWEHYRQSFPDIEGARHEMIEASRLFPAVERLSLYRPSARASEGSVPLRADFLSAFRNLRRLTLWTAPLAGDWQDALDGVSSSLEELMIPCWYALDVFKASKQAWWRNLRRLACRVEISLRTPILLNDFSLPASLTDLDLQYSGQAWPWYNVVRFLLARLPLSSHLRLVKKLPTVDIDAGGVGVADRAPETMDEMIVALERLPNLVSFKWNLDREFASDCKFEFTLTDLLRIVKACPKMSCFQFDTAGRHDRPFESTPGHVDGDMNEFLVQTMNLWTDVQRIELFPCPDEWANRMHNTVPLTSRRICSLSSTIDVFLLAKWLERHPQAWMPSLVYHFPLASCETKSNDPLDRDAFMSALDLIRVRLGGTLSLAVQNAPVAEVAIARTLMTSLAKTSLSGAAHQLQLDVVPLQPHVSCDVLDVSKIVTFAHSYKDSFWQLGPQQDEGNSSQPWWKYMSTLYCSQSLCFRDASDVSGFLQLFSTAVGYWGLRLDSVWIQAALTAEFWKLWFWSVKPQVAVHLERYLTRDEALDLCRWLHLVVKNSEVDEECKHGLKRMQDGGMRQLTFAIPVDCESRLKIALRMARVNLRTEIVQQPDERCVIKIGWLECR